MKVVTFGVDCHEKMYRVVVLMGAVIHRQLTVPARFEELLKLAQKYEDCHIRVAYEAGCFGYGLYRYLVGHGIECKVVPPSMVPQNPGERHKKTDTRDSRALAIHYEHLPAVAVPTEEEELERELLRCREALVKECGRFKRRIVSFLFYHGLKEPLGQRFTKAYRHWLWELELSHESKVVLAAYLSALGTIEVEVTQIECELKKLSQSKRYKKDFRKLTKIKGVGFITAMTFLTEVYRPERFRRSGEVSSYLGLTPQEHSSGERERRGHITRTGNARLRRVLNQAAWVWISNDDKAREKYARLRARRGGKRAIVAMARNLGIIMWRIVVDDVEYRA